MITFSEQRVLEREAKLSQPLTLEQLKLTNDQKKLLGLLGFTQPFIGQIALVESKDTTACWTSEPDAHDEIALLMASFNTASGLRADRGWSYGMIELDLIRNNSKPVEAILEHGYHIDTPYGNKTDFALILPSLVGFAGVAPHST